MYQIDVPTAADALPAPEAMGDPGYFTGGDPGLGIAPTEFPADFANMVMLELLNVVVAAGIAPLKTAYNQLLTAINVLITNADNAMVTALTSRLAMVGDVKPRLALGAPDGWVVGDGGTIGSAASAATTRANADTAALFALLWAGTTDAVLPVQDAGGGASVRGASAAADFAANKRLTLPDFRGVVLRGLDLGRGFGGQTDLAAYLADALQGHHHTLPGMPLNGVGSSFAGSGAGIQASTNITQTGDVSDDGTHGVARVASATRDKSIGVVMLIKL